MAKKKKVLRVPLGKLRIVGANKDLFQIWTGKRWHDVPRELSEGTEINTCLKKLIDIVVLDNCGNKGIIPAVTREIIDSLPKPGNSKVPFSVVAPRVEDEEQAKRVGKIASFTLPKLAEGVNPDNIKTLRISVPAHGYSLRAVGDSVKVHMEGVGTVDFEIIRIEDSDESNQVLHMKRLSEPPSWVGGE